MSIFNHLNHQSIQTRTGWKWATRLKNWLKIQPCIRYSLSMESQHWIFFVNSPRHASKLWVLGSLSLLLTHSIHVQLLNRKSPFGHVVLDSLAELPKYRIKVSQTSVMTDNGKNPVRIKFSIECELVSSASAKVKKFRYHDVTAILSLTSDYDLIDFRRISWAVTVLSSHLWILTKT